MIDGLTGKLLLCVCLSHLGDQFYGSPTMVFVRLFMHPPEGALFMVKSIFFFQDTGKFIRGSRHLTFAGNTDGGQPLHKGLVGNNPNPPRSQRN